MANFPSGFDITPGFTKWKGLTLGAEVVSSQVPCLMPSALSLSHTPRDHSSYSIRCWEAEARSAVIVNIVKFLAQSSFGACI